jgi:hypothetical protein
MKVKGRNRKLLERASANLIGFVVVDALGTSEFSIFTTTAPGNLPFQFRIGIMKSVLAGR